MKQKPVVETTALPLVTQTAFPLVLLLISHPMALKGNYMFSVYVVLSDKAEPIEFGYTKDLQKRFEQYTSVCYKLPVTFCPLFLVEEEPDAKDLTGEMQHLANEYLDANLPGDYTYSAIPPAHITQQGTLFLEHIGEEHISHILKQISGTRRRSSYKHRPTSLSKLLGLE